MNIQLKKLGFLAVITGLTLSLSSCVITRGEPSQKRSSSGTTLKHKKPHPHGGPPGQMKKGKGHPGKKHH